MRYLLDTDTCIEVIRRREPASQRLKDTSPEDVALSAMTLAELRFGALNSSDPDHGLEAVQAFLSAPLHVLPFDADAASHHADLRFALRAAPIGERDLVIAATAQARRLTVVTGNRKHFSRVPELRVEDWCAAEEAGS